MTSILDLSHQSDADQRENGLRQHISYDLLSTALPMRKILKRYLKDIRGKTVYYMVCEREIVPPDRRFKLLKKVTWFKLLKFFRLLKAPKFSLVKSPEKAAGGVEYGRSPSAVVSTLKQC